MRTTEIQFKAEAILRELGIYKASEINLEKITEHLHINLQESDLKEDVSGLFILKNGIANILYNKSQSHHRQRFTIAHEIGHFILHKLPLSMNKKDFKLYRNLESSTGEVKKEREANAFAANLLMPEQFISNEINNAPDNTKNAIEYLANVFKVSEQAMTFRLANLGYSVM